MDPLIFTTGISVVCFIFGFLMGRGFKKDVLSIAFQTGVNTGMDLSKAMVLSVIDKKENEHDENKTTE